MRVSPAVVSAVQSSVSPWEYFSVWPPSKRDAKIVGPFSHRTLCNVTYCLSVLFKHFGIIVFAVAIVDRLSLQSSWVALFQPVGNDQLL